MAWENPLRSIAATVDADVLKVLAGAQSALTGNELARLAGKSYAQVYAVVGLSLSSAQWHTGGSLLTARWICWWSAQVPLTTVT